MMKKVEVKVEKVEGEGLVALLGQPVLILAMNYFYAGVLEGVNDTCVMLSSPKKVFETGVLIGDSWKDAQDLPSPWYVQIGSIESFGPSGR